MKKVKVVVSKVFNLFIYFILLLLIFVFAINLFSKDVSAKTIDTSEVQSFIYINNNGDEFLFQSREQTIFELVIYDETLFMDFVTFSNVTVDSAFSYDYVDLEYNFSLTEKQAILYNSLYRVRPFVGSAQMPYLGDTGNYNVIIYNDYVISYRYVGGVRTFYSRVDLVDMYDQLIYIDNLETSDYSSGYNSGYIDGTSYGYNSGYNLGVDNGYNQGYDYAYDLFYQSRYNAGFDDGVEHAYEQPAVERTILTFTGSILGSVLSFIWLILTAPSIFGINLLTILLLLLTLFVVLTILKIIF